MNLELRRFRLDDAAIVVQLVGDEEVSKWTSNIPFPYSEQDAIAWITSTASSSSRNTYAVEMDGRLVACVSYWPHEPGGVEVGYWVGRAFWGKGICTNGLQLLLASDGFPAHMDVRFAACTGKVRFHILSKRDCIQGWQRNRGEVLCSA